MSEHDHDRSRDREEASQEGGNSAAYLRFIAMIVTAMVVMFGLTYANTFEVSHVKWSETRAYMTLLMGGSMAIIMLGFMLKMYGNRAINIAIVLVGITMMASGTYLVRSQTMVQDTSYMSAMIPHHSIAILTSERSEIQDVRVCELSAAIIEAQRREIEEMKWLLEDIEENGEALTAADAGSRPVPEFEGASTRTCAGR